MSRREEPLPPGLDELAAAEDELAAEVAAVTGTMEEKFDQLRLQGVFAEYSRVFQRYLALARPPRSDLEALKRAAFLAWYEQAEPWCFTGVGELPPDACRSVVELLEPLAGELDEELVWMLRWYYFIAEWAYPALDAHPRLGGILVSGDPQTWRRHRAAAERMRGRGLMGEYWRSVFDSPA